MSPSCTLCGFQQHPKGRWKSVPILGMERLRPEGTKNEGLKVQPAMECQAGQVFPRALILQFVCVLVSVMVPLLGPSSVL